MSKNKAVIDLGSNTFHLLIVNDALEILCKERVFVSLAEEGIERIGDAAFQRGIDTLGQFKKTLRKYQVNQYKVVGTAALRSASNAPNFVKQIKEDLGISIEVIGGLEEANYIYKGIATVVPMHDGAFLIMDIGGGSVEFIIVNEGNLHLAKSFNIGIGQLYSKLPHSYPLENKEKEEIKDYILHHIDEVIDDLKNISLKGLIGSSGSFEVLEAMYGLASKENSYNVLSRKQFQEEAQKVYASSMEQLLARAEIPDSRAKLISLAFLLIDTILEITGIDDLYVSPAAMKEGILSDLKN